MGKIPENLVPAPKIAVYCRGHRNFVYSVGGIEILSTHFVDLWLNKHQIRQKIHPTVLDRVYPRGRNRTLRPLSFPWESFPFLDLRSVGLSDFAPLSHLATLGQTTALLCQTTCPTSLRSRKVKLSRGKKSWSTFPFCPRDTLCLAVGTIIPDCSGLFWWKMNCSNIFLYSNSLAKK